VIGLVTFDGKVYVVTGWFNAIDVYDLADSSNYDPIEKK
jgi:hypothetical protein